VFFLGFLDLAVVALFGFLLLSRFGFARAAQAGFFVFALLGEFAVEFLALFGEFLDFLFVVGRAVEAEDAAAGSTGLGGGFSSAVDMRRISSALMKEAAEEELVVEDESESSLRVAWLSVRLCM
jgi:hypothetical protein